MADTRQFTDHNEIGGVNVYLEDKKLAESPEQNTMASTDYVLLKDEDDIPRKISKANLMSVVKDAIGELLKSNDLGTSVTNVPALNASAFGSATVANLASVLGGKDNQTPSDDALNITPSTGYYIITSDTQNSPSPGKYFFCFAFGSIEVTMLLALETNLGTMYYGVKRNGSVNWAKVATI